MAGESFNAVQVPNVCKRVVHWPSATTRLGWKAKRQLAVKVRYLAPELLVWVAIVSRNFDPIWQAGVALTSTRALGLRHDTVNVSSHFCELRAVCANITAVSLTQIAPQSLQHAHVSKSLQHAHVKHFGFVTRPASLANCRLSGRDRENRPVGG